MKILFIVQGLGNGGAERLCIDIANEIIKSYSEYEVLIVSLNNTNHYKKITKKIQIKKIETDFKLSIFQKNIIKIDAYEEIVNEFKPDIIHSHLYKSELVSRENIRKNIKYITHVHSDFDVFNKLNFNSIFKKLFYTNLFEKTRIFFRYKKANNHFITISNSVNSKLKSQLPKKLKHNVTLMRNAINLDHFASKEISEKQKTNTLNLISVGGLRRIKNHEYQLFVLRNIINKGINCKLYLIGGGAEYDNLQYLINKLHLKDFVTITGFIEEVKEYLDRSQIYIHTAFKEGLSLTTIEAMACGLPIVCLDAEGNRDLIKNNENGFILKKDTNPEHFAEVVLKIHGDPKLRKKLSRNSIKFSENFDIKNYTKELLKLYNM
tara:strand:- start:491 stop:1624 length:1134 start_codon:yes stop_codon:yes gene_type:complete